MKKKTATLEILIFLLAIAAPLNAEKVDVSQAKNIARNFLYNTSVSKLYKKAIVNDLRLTHTEYDGNTPLYYVFDIQSGGFIITSADTRANDILAYVDKGSYITESLPDNMRWWLGEYAREIKAVCALPEEDVKKQRITKTAKAEITPLLKTEWAQNTPYNKFCHYTTGTSNAEAPTGCGAVAMAQIMYYHKWPEKGVGSNSYNYTININGQQVRQHQESNFGEHTYNWNEMLADYSNGYTEEQADAVAQLMHDCGVAINSLFMPVETGSSNGNIRFAMSDFFRYSVFASPAYRDAMGDTEWEELIYNDLSSGLPVFYSGTLRNGAGHAFVCDGYKDGLYHINWGWSGTGNGYYNINGSDALRPYNSGTDSYMEIDGYKYNQYIVTGIKPIKEAEGAVSQEPLTLSPGSATHNDEITITGNILNTLSNYYVSFAIEVQDVASGETKLVGMTDYGIYPGEVENKLSFHAADIPQDGTFEVRPVYQLVGGQSGWHRINTNDGKGNVFKLTITGGLPALYVTEQMTFDYGGLTAIGNIKLNVKLKAVENSEQTELRAYFKDKETGDIAGTLIATVPAMQKDEETIISMTTLTNDSHLQPGDYKLELYLYEDGEAVKLPNTANTIIHNAQVLPNDVYDDIVGINEVATDVQFVDVYSTDGIIIRRKVASSKSLDNLPKGIYIVNGKKVIKK